MKKNLFLFSLYLFSLTGFGQLMVGRDTITVIENGYVLKMPWGGGINYANVSTVDLDLDGKKDVVAYDRVNQFGAGPFRCFLNRGNAGEIKYVAAPEYNYSLPPASNWAFFADYNCDGQEDLWCSTLAGIKVYKNVSIPPSSANSVGTLSFVLVCPTINTTYPIIGLVNLYASSIGVPGVADIDGDGDLDILTFSPQGVFAEYHKNLSKETYGNCDSLIYYAEDLCWGKFSESSCEIDFQPCSAKPKTDRVVGPSGKAYHAGACLTCLDSDGDGDQDLILGDISCNVVQYIHNGGTSISNALMDDTTKLYPNFPAKGNTTTIRINNFPCTYYVDVDNDGKKDLIATPNVFGSENTKSVWFYKNVSATDTVDFQFVKNNFLQDEMIEVGQCSSPVVFDYNLDGKKDLLIGTYGYYASNALNAQLTLYENIGSLSQPVYSLVTRDYGALSTHSLNNVVPTVGDVDGDGDVDICVGTSSGQIHWLENTAGSGNACNFSVFHNNPFAFTTPSGAAAPQLFDIDSDGKLDLLIGMKNGKIAYYQNISYNTSVPTFTLAASFFGSVAVQGNPNLYNIDGYASPFFFHDASGIKLLVGTVGGNIYYYSVPSNIHSAFTLINNSVNYFNEGGQSTVCFEDINHDNLRDLIVGNGSGGLSLFTSTGKDVGLQELSQDSFKALVVLSPNPSTGLVQLDLEKMEVDAANFTVYDLMGKEVLSATVVSNSETLDLRNLNPGIYFVKISVVSRQKNYTVTKKLIKDN